MESVVEAVEVGMSQTRTAAVGGKLRQERFSSSIALNKGLLGNLVARRCETLRSVEERSLIYFLHELSLRDGFAIHRTCNLFATWPWPSDAGVAETSFERLARELTQSFLARFSSAAIRNEVQRELPGFFARLCLDPALNLNDRGIFPRWPSIIADLRTYQVRFCAAVRTEIADTEVTQSIFELLDYARRQRGIVIAEGTYRIGKSFSAQAWCQMHLGEARYVQLSSATSDIGFFRDIARSVGVASSNQRKAFELRGRIEDALRGQHLLLVIDEADYLWPQAVRPHGSPERIAWLMTSAVNNGVPVALIASRNFSRMMRNVEKKCPIWGSEQFLGRIKLRKSLPDSLSKSDLRKVAELLLPNANRATLMLLVGHAMISNGHVADMESAASRAKFFADQARRDVAFEDVERALAESANSHSAEILQTTKTRTAGKSPADPSRSARDGGAARPPFNPQILSKPGVRSFPLTTA